jgi:undecaprenyl phosphate-alpha-L-ara4N flippase subunit ArnE
MAWTNAVILSCCVACIATGQVLFKLAARAFGTSDATIWSVIASPYLIAALFVYAGTTVVWVWQLSIVDLTHAYPFMALSFVAVPLLSRVLLGESVDLQYWVGTGCIVLGVFVINGRALHGPLP